MAQADFENLLNKTMGLDPAAVGSNTIERAVRMRMVRAGLEQMPDYWNQLRNSNVELQELIEAVVVPETWFFRDREVFAAMVRLVTEEGLHGRPTEPLRLLSVPCSTGEEPYSMVMALLDAGFSAWQLNVDAVDISAQALARAKCGEYRAYSFRGENLAFRERYFRPTENGYSLPAWLLDLVSFQHGNLLSAGFRFRQDTYDVIFCRNLLIYFDRTAQERALRILGSRLAPGGFLFVGSAEAFLAARSGFTPVNQSMSFAFRKTAAKPAESRDLLIRRPKTPASRHPDPRAKRAIKTDLSPVSTPAPSLPGMIDLETGRRLADAGRLQEAAQLCESYLQQQGLSSEAYYLLGVVRDALGDLEGAAECYRRTVYLEPEHMEALMHLALLVEKQGDIGDAQRLRERVRRLQGRAEQKAF